MSESKWKVECPECHWKGRRQQPFNMTLAPGGTINIVSRKKPCPRCGSKWLNYFLAVAT